MRMDSIIWIGRSGIAALAALAAALLTGMPLQVAAAAPVNDDFASATTLTGLSAMDTVSNVSATKETDEPNHVGDPGGLSVWWTWTAPEDGLLTVTTAGSEADGGGPLDTVLAIYTGSSLAGLEATEVAANDQERGANGTSRTLLLVRSGEMFRIAVDSSAFGGPIGGNVTLTLSLDPMSNNDHLADRIVLSGASVSLDWTNRGGSREMGEATHGGTGGASVWWEWTAPADGAVTITTAGPLPQPESQVDTRLAIYTGDPSSHATLQQFANNDDSGGDLTSLITFAAVSGTKYYIAVDGKNGSVGDFFFCISTGIPATIDSIQRMPDGTTDLSITVLASCRIRIEYNENLGNPQGWTRVQNGTIASPGGTIAFQDMTSTASTSRFYRIVAP